MPTSQSQRQHHSHTPQSIKLTTNITTQHTTTPTQSHQPNTKFKPHTTLRQSTPFQRLTITTHKPTPQHTLRPQTQTLQKNLPQQPPITHLTQSPHTNRSLPSKPTHNHQHQRRLHNQNPIPHQRQSTTNHEPYFTQTLQTTHKHNTISPHTHSHTKQRRLTQLPHTQQHTKLFQTKATHLQPQKITLRSLQRRTP